VIDAEVRKNRHVMLLKEISAVNSIEFLSGLASKLFV